MLYGLTWQRLGIIRDMAHTTQQSAFRWVILFAAAIILALSMGLLINGISAFFIPLEKAFGWKRGDVSLINTCGLIGCAIGGMVMGRMAEKFGTRPVCVFGALVLGVCVVVSAYADQLWQFYALYLLGGACGGAAFFAPLVALVGNWFRSGAGLALGIVSGGQAVGQGGIPLVSAALIELLSWDGALLVLGGVILAVVFPLTFLMREPPPQPGAAPAASGAPAKALPYKLVVITMSAAVLGCCTLMAVPLVHLLPLMQGKGISATDAGGVMLVMLSVAVFGRICFGRLSDMIGAVPAYVAASVWQTVMVFGFVFFESLGAFYLYAALYGFGYAGVMTGILTTTRALVVPERRASAMGFIGGFAFLAHGLGGWQAGYLFDLTNSYTAGYGVAAAAGVANQLIMSTLVLRMRRDRMPVPA
jgi:MFS family permease